MWPRVLTRLPARLTAPLLLAGPVLLVSAALITVSFVRGRSASRELALAGFADIHRGIGQQLGQMLSAPPQVTSLNAALLDEGALPLDAQAQWQRVWLGQARLFAALSCISWDGADGRQVWIARYPGDPTYWFAVNSDRGEGDVVERPYGPSGQLQADRSRHYQIDPREFAPFQTASRAGRGTWCEPFEWVNEDSSTLTFSLAYAEPYRGPDGALAGVLTAQLTLEDISQFLGTLPLSDRGQSFVVDRQGRLIGCSRLTAMVDARRRRLPAERAELPDIAAASRFVSARAGGFGGSGREYQGRLRVRGEPYLVMVSPFEHETGLYWTVVTLAPEADFLGSVVRARYEGLAIAGGLTAATLVAGALLGRLAVRPLLRLVEHVRRIDGGDLDGTLALHQSPEFTQLSDAINTMTGHLRDRLALRQSLELARQVQRHLLPARRPEVPGLEVASLSRYCDQTGGDYYDFLAPDPASLCVVVGDVMGHGIAAAMLMAMARGVLRSQWSMGGSLASVLGHLNRQIAGDAGDMGRFMTMILLVVEPAGRQLRWAPAGHDPPLLYDPAQDRFVDFDTGGVPLGVLDRPEYEEHLHTPLRAGQVLLIGTDGVWETRRPDGEFFGKDRLRTLLRLHADEPAETLAARLDAALDAFREGAAPADDVTFVVVKVTG